jgi:hypothetical protein
MFFLDMGVPCSTAPGGATLRKTYLADSQKELVNLTAEVAKSNISEAAWHHVLTHKNIRRFPWQLLPIWGISYCIAAMFIEGAGS